MSADQVQSKLQRVVGLHIELAGGFDRYIAAPGAERAEERFAVVVRHAGGVFEFKSEADFRAALFCALRYRFIREAIEPSDPEQDAEGYFETWRLRLPELEVGDSVVPAPHYFDQALDNAIAEESPRLKDAMETARFKGRGLE